MKKFFRSIPLLALLLTFVSCGNLHFGLNKKGNEAQKDKGQFTISFAGARMVYPGVDWKIDNVTEWNVTFTENVTTDPYEETKTIEMEDGKLIASLPVGNYKIEVKGTVDADNDGTAEYVLYGHEDDVELTTDGAEVTVYLSLSKKGNGSFSYDLTINKTAFVGILGNELTDIIAVSATTENVYVLDKDISAYLVKTTDSSTTIPLSITCTQESIPAAEDSTLEITFSKTGVPSGYYYLIIKYGSTDEEVITITPDNIVEIADDLESEGNFTISAFENKSVKTIYVNNDDGTNNNKNGVLNTNPKGLNSAISWLAANKDKWDEANLDYVGTDTPVISIDTNPTATTDAASKKVTITWGENFKIVYSQGKISLASTTYRELALSSETADTECTIYTTSANTAENPLSIGAISLCNVLLTIDGVYASNNDTVTVIPAVYEEYASTNDPFLTINYADANRYKVVLEDSEYTVIPSTSGNTVSYYTALAGQATITIGRKLPNFTISGSKYYQIADANVSFAATPAEGESFVEGDTTFEWKLNGLVIADAEEATLNLNLATNDNIVNGKNTITCIATYDGESASATHEISLYTPGIISFNRGSTSYDELWTTSYELSDGSTWAGKNSQDLTAYCYDDDRNLYLSLKGSDGNFKLVKYTYEGNDTYNATATNIVALSNTTLGNYKYPARMTCDENNIYFFVTNTLYGLRYDENVIYSCPKAGLNSTAPTLADLTKIDFSDKYDVVTAIAYDSGKMYVAGYKKPDTIMKPTQAAQTVINEKGFNLEDNDNSKEAYNYEYYLDSYECDSTGIKIDTAERLIEYTDSSIFDENEDLLVFSMYDVGGESSAVLFPKINALITDIGTLNGDIYVIRNSFVYFNYLYSSTNTSYVSKYWKKADIYYLPSGSTTLKKYGLPSKDASAQGTPVRFIAIKPKELILSDGSSYSNTLDRVRLGDEAEIDFVNSGTGSSDYMFDDALCQGSGDTVDSHNTGAIFVTTLASN